MNDFFNSFPSFQFEFERDGSVNIEWKAEGYLYNDPDSRNSNMYSFAFESYSTSKVFLGGPFMKNYDILFDKNANII